MEEKDYRMTDDISGLLAENNKRIEPDPLSKKFTRIRPYFLLTVSTALFILAFIFADAGAHIIKSESKYIPALLASEFLGEDGKYNEQTFSEYQLWSILGINNIRADEIISSLQTGNSDEHKSNGKKDPDREITDASVNEDPDDGHSTETTEVDPENTSPDDESVKKYPIVSMDLSYKSLGEYYIGNETTYSPDIKALLEKENAVPAFSSYENSDGPLVLILHTHGTESYAEEGKSFYIDDGGDISRTDDTKKNVVAVGKVMADILNENGIGTVHCTIMHDKESYQDSYTRAAESIKRYLAKYPSIKYVFDVHRDAILKSDGSLVKAVTEINGEKVAQVMSVVGSNYKGADYKDWEDRLSLALKLKSKLSEKYPLLSRPVYLRGAAYNQQYAMGSMLLEIGSSGNTLEEAKRAAELVALALVDIIKGK